MFQVGNTIVSEAILDNEFACNLSACKGACCIDGDAGAPLSEDELDIISQIFDDLKPYMRPEGLSAIEQQGLYVVDTDGDNTKQSFPIVILRGFGMTKEDSHSFASVLCEKYGHQIITVDKFCKLVSTKLNLV